MKRIIAVLVAVLLAFVFGACRPKRQPPPDYDQVRDNHEKAQQDLKKEEDKKKQQESDDSQ